MHPSSCKTEKLCQIAWSQGLYDSSNIWSILILYDIECDLKTTKSRWHCFNLVSFIISLTPLPHTVTFISKLLSDWRFRIIEAQTAHPDIWGSDCSYEALYNNLSPFICSRLLITGGLSLGQPFHSLCLRLSGWAEIEGVGLCALAVFESMLWLHVSEFPSFFFFF